MVDVLQSQYLDRVPAVSPRQVHTIQTAPTTVDVPQSSFFNRLVDVPVAIQFIDRILDVLVALQREVLVIQKVVPEVPRSHMCRSLTECSP